MALDGMLKGLNQCNRKWCVYLLVLKLSQKAESHRNPESQWLGI